MSSPSWNDYLLTGIARIDEQHKKLVKRVDALIDAIRASTADDELHVMLNFLGQYVIFHFDAEVEYMEEIGHYSLEEHRAEHEAPKKALSNFNMALAEGGASGELADKVKTEILNRVVNHIGRMDKQLAVV